VVFTGWAPAGGPSEGEQMLEAWPGRRDVELVAERTATVTAENASRSLPLLLERGVREATVVCTPLHLGRVRYLFPALYARYGIRCRVRVAWAVPTASALAWELGALAVLRRQRRAALAELLVALSHKDAPASDPGTDAVVRPHREFVALSHKDPPASDPGTDAVVRPHREFVALSHKRSSALDA
nr:YdcF family protein [Actinomycetota bacterium]